MRHLDKITRYVAIGCSFTEGCELGNDLNLSPNGVTSRWDPRCTPGHANWMFMKSYPYIVGHSINPKAQVINIGMAGTSNDYNAMRLIEFMAQDGGDIQNTTIIFGSTNMDRYAVYYNGRPIPIIPHTFNQYLNTNLRHAELAANITDVVLYSDFCKLDVLINGNFDTCARRMLHAWRDVVNAAEMYGYGRIVIVPAFGTRPFWFFNNPADFHRHHIPADIEVGYQLIKEYLMESSGCPTFRDYMRDVLFSNDMYAAAQKANLPVTSSHALEEGQYNFAMRVVSHLIKGRS